MVNGLVLQLVILKIPDQYNTEPQWNSELSKMLKTRKFRYRIIPTADQIYTIDKINSTQFSQAEKVMKIQSIIKVKNTVTTNANIRVKYENFIFGSVQCPVIHDVAYSPVTCEFKVGNMQACTRG